jgi:hypothetical protein
MSTNATPLPANTFTMRQLGPNNDPIWGQGTANFLQGAAAVAQAIYANLYVWEGEWWENADFGVPMWQSILGQGAPASLIALLLQNVILSVPYVMAGGVTNLEYSLANKQFSMSADVQTAFGVVQMTYPQPLAQGIP